MTTNQKLYAWHEARMSVGVIATAAATAVSIYAMSPWVREKCYNLKEGISSKFRKHKKR